MRELPPSDQNYFRDYDSAIGRYVESDPIGLRGGINTYLYAQANPLLFSDFAGLFSYNKPPPDTVPVPADVEQKIVCIENCLGRQLVITGGAETKGHGAKSRHYVGEAADFGFNSNLGLRSDPKKFFCCAAKCGFKFGQTEGGKGPHFHIQVGLGKHGGPGEIPKDGSDSCECKGS
jgi:hypothetical protein